MIDDSTVLCTTDVCSTMYVAIILVLVLVLANILVLVLAVAC